MADPAITVPLPPSVDQFILQICTEQSHPPPDTVARRRLASIGEEASLQLLRNISSWSIQNISQTIMNMTSPPPHSSPQRKACMLSPQKQQQQQRSPSPAAQSCLSPQKSPVTVRWYGNSQGSPSSSSENPTRQAINLQLGCTSSISDNPVGQAFNPSPVAHSCMSPHKSPVTTRWYGNSPGSPSSSSELGLPSSRSENLNKREFSPQELALGELEFRKAFLILSYTAKNRLEDLISADEIRGLKHLAMSNFELRVWQAFGYKCIKQEDRQLAIDWESGKTFLYHCFVSEDGSYTFKGPFINKEKNHLQRVLGDDNVLNVKFAEGATDRNYSVVNSYVNKSRFSRIFRDGILVGPRCFRFLVFKDGGKEAKKEDSTASPVKCYFVRMESHASMNSDSSYILSNKIAYEARCLFMHVHTVATVAKYMARFSLILSKTIKLEVDLASLHIEMIDDIPCRDEDGSKVFIEDGELCIHTDGTGFISEDLAVMCPRNIYKGKHNNTLSERFLCNAGVGETTSELQQPQSQILEPPLLIQCRMFNDGCAVKGTLLVNRKLPPKTIQYRPSMLKVITDPKLSDVPTVNSLEIVGTSNQPRKTLLSRNLIALLYYGGVPEQYFMDILLNALKEAQSIHNDKRAAFRASLNHGRVDDFIVASMISSGIPLDEPFLQYRLSILLKEERKSLQGGKLPISDSFYLMGTADPTGKLKSDEVCIILDNGQISGIREKVLVYRNPGLHFGDIHILKATYVKEMEDFVGNAKYAIFFPTQGHRSLADEMAGGDFDGDMFFVSRNIQLLDSFNPSDPWTPTNSKEHVLDKKIIGPSRHADSKEPVCDRKPADFSAEDLEHELFQLFLTTRFQPSKAAGMAANSWLACMDRLLILGDEDAEEKEILKKKLLLLIDIYYDALDAPKSGMKIEVPKRLIPEKYPHYMENSMSKAYNSSSILGKIFDRVGSYQKENQVVQEISLLPCFEDAEIPESCFKLWKEHYENYLREMTDALKHPDEIKNESADAVINKYKQILYGAPEFEQTHRNIEEIFDEALAIYKICYDYAWIKEDVGKCQFAWKVAGKALCMIYVRKQGDKSIPCSFSFLRDIFC